MSLDEEWELGRNIEWNNCIQSNSDYPRLVKRNNNSENIKLVNSPTCFGVAPYHSHPLVGGLSPCLVASLCTEVMSITWSCHKAKRRASSSSCRLDLGSGPWSFSSKQMLIEHVLCTRQAHRLYWCCPWNNLKFYKSAVSQKQPKR